ncbi:MAG: biotin--[acetyl-CoA-carboxylase] ligase [Sedimentisphaerales bacterium]|nr:biotin--[acetyl-CoA-carboxylase] ligase [Sedimentisphaerales bacterium]
MTVIPDQLNTDLIRQDLTTRRLGNSVLSLDCTESTNDIAWQQVARADCDGLCILAEQQTAGRGRRGRTWLSPKGQSILCSIVIRHIVTAPPLTLAAPVAVADMITTACSLHPIIKWPNDILLADRKTAGILVESRKIREQIWSVIGIGINVHQGRQVFAEAVDLPPATSLDIETGRFVNRNPLVCCLLERLEAWVTAAETDPDSLLCHWRKYNRQIGTRIELESDGRPYRGTCIGIDPTQGLIVQLEDGPIRIFSAAHSSILKTP